MKQAVGNVAIRGSQTSKVNFSRTATGAADSSLSAYNIDTDSIVSARISILKPLTGKN